MATGGRTRGVSNRELNKLVRKTDRWMQRSGSALVDRFGEETATKMREEILDEIRRRIPQLPYIGGRRNIYSGELSLSGWALATYRVVLRHGGSLEDTGELLHGMVRAEAERIPKAARSILRRYRFSRLRQRKLEKAARRSQARRYPGDWVFERIEGDGETFDFGIDMTECGIAKFLHTQGADELCPYLCDLDYVMAEALGIGLQRTKTLAWDCDRCDFRLSRHATTSAPWPPEFVERTCGQPETKERTVVS